MIDVLQLIKNLKNDYNNKFHDNNNNVMHMIKQLNDDYYNWFESCTNIIQVDEYVLLSYTMLKGGETDLYSNPNSILRNCRGTIINVDTEELVLLPFRKFFNIGEVEETQLPLFMDKMNHAKIIEITDKMDGSMLACRWYNNDVFTGSTGSFCLQPAKKNPRFKRAKNFFTEQHKQMFKDYERYTFIFEFILYDMPQIVEYTEEQQGIYLNGARNIDTGEEMTYHQLKELSDNYGIKMVQFENHSFAEIRNMASDFTAQEKEGWVIRVDKELYKFKCDDFCHFMKLLGCSPNVILKAWIAGVLDDEKAYLSKSNNKQMIEYIEFYEKKFELYVQKRTQEINDNYAKFAHIKPMKEFAIAVSKSNLDKQMKGFVINIRRIEMGEEKTNNLFSRVRYNDILEYLGEL